VASTLNQHSRIVVPDETDFIVPLAFLCDRIPEPAAGRDMIVRLLQGASQTRAALQPFLSPREMRRAVYGCAYEPFAILESLYAAVARAAGKPIAGDKSPNDLNFIRILFKKGLERASQPVVHIVRDLRDVMVSLRRVEWDAHDVIDWFPELWSHSNLYLHRRMSLSPQRYLLLRYEDLVCAPEQHFSRLCQFLGVPFEETMLDPVARGQRYAGQPHHQHLSESVTAAHVGRWRQELPAEIAARCETAAGEALRQFGYLL